MSSVQQVFKYLSLMYGSRRGSSKISCCTLLYLTPQWWIEHVLSQAIKSYYFRHFRTLPWLKRCTHYPILQQHTLYTNEQFYILGLGDLLTRSKESAENSAKEHFKLRRKRFMKQQKIPFADTDFWETGRLICQLSVCFRLSYLIR